MAQVSAVKVVEKVLEFNELDDYAGILNIAASSADTCVTKKSAPAALRKLYLKLSLIIHPDRVGKTIPNATKAFQALVKAFETLSSPDLQAEPSGRKGRGEKEVKTIARSNENCFRTRVCCPRCKQPWSENTLDGNPEYFYNFLMTGLKQYMCSTCLCEFGCMTAIHKCPHCKKRFDYSPADYHKQIQCGNEGCKKPFGFYLYPTSDRVMSEMRKTLKEEQEARIKATEAKQRRAARSSQRGGGSLSQKELEASFLLGLTDCCPRCGEDFTESFLDEQAQLRHLAECTDSVKHGEYAKKKESAAAKQRDKESKKASQDAAQTLATWQFLGSNTEQLWLLDDAQLRQQAIEASVDSSGDKEELISRLVRRSKQRSAAATADNSDDNEVEEVGASSSGGRRCKRLLTNGTTTATTGAVVAVSSKRVKTNTTSSSSNSSKSRNTIPSNLHSMTLTQLRAVCASNDILHLIDKSMSKAEVLDVLENEFYEAKDTKQLYLKN